MEATLQRSVTATKPPEQIRIIRLTNILQKQIQISIRTAAKTQPIYHKLQPLLDQRLSKLKRTSLSTLAIIQASNKPKMCRSLFLHLITQAIRQEHQQIQTSKRHHSILTKKERVSFKTNLLQTI